MPSSPTNGDSVLKAIHVTMANKPGQLAQATRILADAGINVEALETEILGASAFFRFFTKDVAKAHEVLRGRGYIVLEQDIVEVRIANRPGEIARVCEVLSKASINIESLFGSNAGPNREATLYLRVSDPTKAERALKAAKIAAAYRVK